VGLHILTTNADMQNCRLRMQTVLEAILLCAQQKQFMSERDFHSEIHMICQLPGKLITDKLYIVYQLNTMQVF